MMRQLQAGTIFIKTIVVVIKDTLNELRLRVSCQTETYLLRF